MPPKPIKQWATNYTIVLTPPQLGETRVIINAKGERTYEKFMAVVEGKPDWYLHNTEGPAKITLKCIEWCVNGKHHRTDGPAIEWVNGEKEWWLNGVKHREDGPAYEARDGYKAWYRNGRLHREDGPAIIVSDGDSRWYLNNTLYKTEKEWQTALEVLKAQRITELF